MVNFSGLSQSFSLYTSVVVGNIMNAGLMSALLYVPNEWKHIV
jgi:hypothetical protein